MRHSILQKIQDVVEQKKSILHIILKMDWIHRVSIQLTFCLNNSTAIAMDTIAVVSRLDGQAIDEAI